MSILKTSYCIKKNPTHLNFEFLKIEKCKNGSHPPRRYKIRLKSNTPDQYHENGQNEKTAY